MAENAASAPPAPVMTTQVLIPPQPAPPPAPAPAPVAPPVQWQPLPQHLPQPQPPLQPQPQLQAPYPPAQALAPQPSQVPAEASGPQHTPSSAWEASNPPQASPLPAAVGGGVMNPAWPPAGTELPPPSLPAPPGSPHPVMESVLQMPGVHQSQSVLSQSQPRAQGVAGSAPFPPSPPPRTSPLTHPAASQRFKSSRGYSGTRKGPAVLAILMALMAIAGTAWFFRDQIRVAWTTHMAAREAEADALEFHPTPPSPDEPATSPTAFDPSNPPPKATPNSPTSPEGKTPAPAPVASVGTDGAPTQADSTSGESPANPGSTPPEQVQRPAVGANSSSNAKGATPVPEPPPQPTAPHLVEVPSASPPSAGSSTGSENTPPKRPAPPIPDTPMIADVPPEARPALEALQQFLIAPTWEERIKVVQGADLMRPLMQSYYSSMPDGPLRVAKIGLIRHDKAPQTGPPHCVFQVGGGDVKRPLPIMVEQSPDGWKVDWLTFTEFKDNLLARFMESPQEGPKRFHVLVRRTHYFDDNVPEVDKKICVEVQAPTPPFVGSVFAQKGTPVSNILDRYLGWEVDQAAAVVELEWRREGDQQWVELTNLPQFNWRNAIAGEVVPPPHAAPTTPVAVPAK